MTFSISYTKGETHSRCPRYYFYDRIKRIEHEDLRLGMKFGNCGHKGLHKLYETGNINLALKTATDAWAPFEGKDVQKDGKPGIRTKAKMEEILEAYHDQIYRNEKWEDQGGEILESFQIEIPHFLEDAFMHIGYFEKHILYRFKIDRKGLSGGIPSIQEWKFLKPLFGLDFVPEPNNQIIGYLKGVNARKAIVTVAKLYASSIKGMVQPRRKSDPPYSIFTRDPVHFQPEVFVEFEKDMLMWSLMIMTCNAYGYWPKNAPGGCNAFGGCQFKTLCAAPEEQRPLLIELQYHKKENEKEEK